MSLGAELRQVGIACRNEASRHSKVMICMFILEIRVECWIQRGSAKGRERERTFYITCKIDSEAEIGYLDSNSVIPTPLILPRYKAICHWKRNKKLVRPSSPKQKSGAVKKGQ